MATPSLPIRIHSTEGSAVPAMQTMQYATGQTFLTGEVLIYSSGEVVVGGTNPDNIVGIALQGAGTNPGYDVANSSQTTVYTGRKQTVTVNRPNDQTIYAAQLTNNSSTVIAPTQADVGAQYGLTAYSNIWTVDKNKTSANARVTVVGFSTDVYGVGIVFFKFMSSHLG